MGDQETLASVKNPKYHPIFLPMCPTYTIIDRANGKFNKAMGFKKDIIAILSSAWEIDQAINKYLTDPDAESDEEMKLLGLVTGFMHETTDEEKEKYLNTIVSILTEIAPSFRKRFFSDESAELLKEYYTLV